LALATTFEIGQQTLKASFPGSATKQQPKYFDPLIEFVHRKATPH
jgi:hypothetical protein